jgi:hypothetical protein
MVRFIAFSAEGPQMTDYRIDVVDAHGNFIRSVHIDCTDDKAAIESAKQFIHGHDIELWQRNRLLDRFDHKHATVRPSAAS